MFFNVNEASVYRALLAFIFSEKIFEGGMTRRDSRHCPQFLDSGNSSEFSISGGPVCSKARDSVLYEQSFLAGFPLFKQRGINYPPTFVGFETKRCLKSIRQDGWWKVEPSMLERRNVDRCDWYIKSMEQHFLSYNPILRMQIIVTTGL